MGNCRIEMHLFIRSILWVCFIRLLTFIEKIVPAILANSVKYSVEYRSGSVLAFTFDTNVIILALR